MIAHCGPPAQKKLILYFKSSVDPAVRNGINMWIAVLTQMYSQTWLLAAVLSNIEAEQMKRKEKKGRQREKSLLTAAFFMLTHVVKMLPSKLYWDNWPIVPVGIKETTAEDIKPYGQRRLPSLLQHTVYCNAVKSGWQKPIIMTQIV